MDFIEVNIISQVVTLQRMLLFPVLGESLLELLELLDSLKDITFFRFDVIGLDMLDIYLIIQTQVCHGFSLDSLLPFDDVHLALEELLVANGVVPGFVFLFPSLHVVVLFGLLINTRYTMRCWTLWKEVKLLEESVDSTSGYRAHREPIPHLVLVQNDTPFVSFLMSWHPIADPFDVFSSQVFLLTLHDNVPEWMIFNTALTKSYFSFH